MFVLGFLVGALVVAAVVVMVTSRIWSMRSQSPWVSLLARQRIEELERQTINRMLREAQAERRSGGVTRFDS